MGKKLMQLATSARISFDSHIFETMSAGTVQIVQNRPEERRGGHSQQRKDEKVNHNRSEYQPDPDDVRYGFALRDNEYRTGEVR